MLKALIGVAVVLILLPFSALAALLVLLWMFWEKLGNLTLKVYDDYQRNKVIRSLSEVLSIDI
jgi:hypothetical protein